MESWGSYPIFQYSTLGKNPTEQPQNLFFFQHCNLSRIAVFSKPVAMQKVIKHEPLIRERQVNTHWKAGGVLYR
jgi:hypothetical protein